MTERFTYQSPNDTVFTVRNVAVKFGEGAVNELGYEAVQLGMERPLVITDENISENTAIADTVLYHLEEAGLEPTLYGGAPVEPTAAGVLAAIDFADKGKYDGFVGLGGGSSIDTAKMVNLYTTYPTGDFKDYIAPPTGGGKVVPGPLKPLLAVPTTAGTGSENTPVAVVDLVEEQLKVGISSPHMQPDLAILDPVLTLSLDPYYTSSSGMDALFHSIECYTAVPYNARERPPSPDKRSVYVGSNPPSDIFVEKSIELVGKYLRRAYHNPHDLEARSQLLLAAHLGGAFGNAGVHIPHALSYPIAGERHDLPHGIVVSVTGPAALEFIAPVMPEKVANLARLLGEKVDGLALDEAALKAKEAIIKLMRDIEFPSGIAEFGFDEDDVSRLAKNGMKIERLLSMSPRRVKLEQLEGILRKSIRNW